MIEYNRLSRQATVVAREPIPPLWRWWTIPNVQADPASRWKDATRKTFVCHKPFCQRPDSAEGWGGIPLKPKGLGLGSRHNIVYSPPACLERSGYCITARTSGLECSSQHSADSAISLNFSSSCLCERPGFFTEPASLRASRHWHSSPAPDAAWSPRARLRPLPLAKCPAR